MTHPSTSRRRAALVALTAAMSAAAPAAQDAPTEYLLRPQLRRGQRLFFVEKTRQRIEIETPYQPTTQSLAIARTMMVEVLEVTPDGSAELALAVVRVHGEVGLPLGDKRPFDTLDPELAQDPDKLAGLGVAVRSRIGEANKLLVLRTDPRGAVVGDLTAAPQVPDQDPLEPAQQARLKRVVEAMFGRAPDEPVRVGATWAHVLASADPELPTVQRTDVTLERATDEQLTLRLSGTIRTDAALATPKTIQVEGEVEGVQRLDPRGVVLATALKAVAAVEVIGMDELPAKMRLESSLRRASADELRELRQRAGSSAQRAEHLAKVAKSTADVRTLRTAVQRYIIKNGALPPNLEALVGLQVQELPSDGWGNPYELVTGAEMKDFFVRSRGPDGEADTEDDVTSRRRR